MIRLPSRGRTALLSLGALVACAAAGAGTMVVAGLACLPDLPGAPGPADGGGPPPLCGNGVIDIDAREQCDPGDANVAGCNRKNCSWECSGLVAPLNDHCYFAAGTALALSGGGSAEVACGAYGNAVHVVTFASEAEYGEVVAYFALSDAGKFDRFWVGLDPSNRYDSVWVYEPGWSTVCSGCYAHADDAGAPLPPFDLGGDSGRAENCVAALPDASSWEAYPCGAGPRAGVICEQEPIGLQSTPCDAGICIDLFATHGTKRYVYVPGHAGAPLAAQTCKGLGGAVVMFDTRDEREQLWRQLSLLEGPPTAFWIGLTLADAGSPDGSPAWVWDDGQPFDDAPDARPSPWGDNAPQPSGTYGRAYVVYFGPMARRDNTLAQNSGVGLINGELPSIVCQVPP